MNQICCNSLASELQSHLGEAVDWGRKFLVNFNASKTDLVSFNRSCNYRAIDVNWIRESVSKN